MGSDPDEEAADAALAPLSERFAVHHHEYMKQGFSPWQTHARCIKAVVDEELAKAAKAIRAVGEDKFKADIDAGLCYEASARIVEALSKKGPPHA